MTRATEPVETPAAYAVRLGAALPKGDANGLRDHARILVEQPKERRYAIVELDTARVIDDLDAGSDTAVVRVLRIEVLDGEHREQAEALMLAAATGRGADPALGDDGDEE